MCMSSPLVGRKFDLTEVHFKSVFGLGRGYLDNSNQLCEKLQLRWLVGRIFSGLIFFFSFFFFLNLCSLFFGLCVWLFIVFVTHTLKFILS